MEHPFHKLNELISNFSANKDKMSSSDLQSLREDLALNLYFMNDSAAKVVANYEAADFNRKRFYASRQEYYRGKKNDNGKMYTVADAERLSRLEGEEQDNKVSEALRQKERVRLIVLATKEILNAIAGKLNQMS